MLGTCLVEVDLRAHELLYRVNFYLAAQNVGVGRQSHHLCYFLHFLSVG